jgi:deoxyhypusine synthase
MKVIELVEQETTDQQLATERKRLLAKPITQLDITDNMTVGDLISQFSGMAIQARNLGTAAKIWEKMLSDPETPTIFLGLTGPLIAAGQRNIIANLIRKRMVDVVVSTGAIIYQDFLYSVGGQHCQGYIEANNKHLRELRINRIFDVFTDDYKFEEADDEISKFTNNLEPGNYSSREFLYHLAKNTGDENSILKASLDANVPIFVPALNDSSIGIGLTKYWAEKKDQPKVVIDSIKDNYELVQIILNSKSTAAVYIGGGVPKNFVNDAIVMANFDFDADIEGHSYAIQVSTATPMDGGLSGSTLNEAVSWGKIQNETRNAMVFLEASIGLPMLYAYLNEQDAAKDRNYPELKI